ncbi:hypothetical protein ACFOW4_25435 [Micromonospora sp. GCM10011542]
MTGERPVREVVAWTIAEARFKPAAEPTRRFTGCHPLRLGTF